MEYCLSITFDHKKFYPLTVGEGGLRFFESKVAGLAYLNGLTTSGQMPRLPETSVTVKHINELQMLATIAV